MQSRPFESKWDGVRAIATTGAKLPALWSRNGNNNFSASFPEIVDALSAVLDHRETVLDGEIIALGPDGDAIPANQRNHDVYVNSGFASQSFTSDELEHDPTYVLQRN